MALYAVSLRQARERGGVPLYKWSNRFYTEADSSFVAASRGVAWWATYLRNAARTDVWCYQVYATDVAPPNAGGTPTTSDFTILPVSQGDARGNLSTQSTEPGAYWRDLSLVVELRVPNSRPDRKFWRPGFMESDFNFSGVFENILLLSAVFSSFNNLLQTGELRSGDGEFITSVTPRRATTRRLGRLAFYDLPSPPPVG